MDFSIWTVLCIFFYHFQVILSRTQQCTVEDGIKIIPVCEARTCDGRYVAISSNAVQSDTSVACSCNITIYRAQWALIHYKSPGYDNCGLHYDLGMQRFSCEDATINLETATNRIDFHKAAGTSASSSFSISIDDTFQDGSVVIQCYTNLITTQRPSETTDSIGKITSETTTGKYKSPLTSSEIPSISPSEHRSAPISTQKSSSLQATTEMLSMSSIKTTSSLRTVSLSQSTSVSYLTASSSPSVPLSTRTSDEMSEKTTMMTQTTVGSLLNTTPEAIPVASLSGTFNRRVLIWSVAGGVAGIFVLTVVVVTIITIRKRRMSKQTLNTQEGSYIDAFNNTSEEPTVITNAFASADYVQANNINPYNMTGNHQDYLPSDRSVSSGTASDSYVWDSPVQHEAVYDPEPHEHLSYTDNLEYSGIPTVGGTIETAVELRQVYDDENDHLQDDHAFVDDSEDNRSDVQELEHVEGQVNSDIYTIVTKRNAGLKFEKRMSSLMSFKTD